MNESVFIPTQEWNVTDDLDQNVQTARMEINAENSEVLLTNLRSQIQKSESGITFAVLKGEDPQEYSDTDALVLFNPFANGAHDGMLIRAEFVRRVAKLSDIRDEEGKLKPVIMLASPTFEKGSKLRLTKEQRNQVENGELGVVAEKLLHVVEEQDFGRVGLRGFSQGADVALAGGRKLFMGNLDVGSVVVGDPVAQEDRKPVKLISDFSKAGPKQLKQSIDRANIQVGKSSKFKENLGFAIFGASALLIEDNRALYTGMGTNSFESRVQEILNEGEVEKLIVAYGDNDAITKKEVIEPVFQRINDKNGDDSVMSVRVVGGDHSWGDQLTLLAKLYTMAS